MSSFLASPPPYPALSLFPLNDTFQPKQILLNQRSKIGRQSNAKTVPTERNGYFDTKVISRQHAEVWAEDGKIWIKDVKSSNGTYINTHRLAPEGVESEPFELHTGDILELGTDIASDDNMKIVHHKVAARVTCILTPEDAQAFAGSRQQQDPQGAQFAFSNGNQGQPQRRPMSQMAMGAMGGMGGSSRAPGSRPGLSFDHIMSKIQTELQKSRETGAELNGLATAMNDIQDTLGGTLPMVPSQQPRPLTNGSGGLPPPPPAPAPAELAALQSQLNEAQVWISGQVDKFKSFALDNVANELTALRRDVNVLRELMHSQRVASDEVSRSQGAVSPVARVLAREEAAERGEDDDDARSVVTIVPEHDRDSFDEEDEAKWADNVRPGSPEQAAPHPESERDATWQEIAIPPASTQLTVDEHEAPQPLSPGKPGRPRLQPRREKEREEETARQLENVLSLARELERQHAEATETIRALQDKVLELEARDSVRSLEEKVRTIEERQVEHDERVGSVQHALEGLRVEWSSTREDWSTERTRIAKAFDDFETARLKTENDIAQAHALAQAAHMRAPPSPPKSVSADSADSDEASGDLGEDDGRSLPIPSPKRKKNRRKKSPMRIVSGPSKDSANDTDPPQEEWERKALLTPSSMSSGSSGMRRLVNGQWVASAPGRDSIASSLDSLDGDSSAASSGKGPSSSVRRPDTTPNNNIAPIAGTLAVFVVALAFAYGRDLRLVT
ncbi:hypothetical protein AURDEDRAFT_110149 [Auricularia subglabra TFB-10046 SS5]|nr:hypothetical protein AURDEDRAFT_110149 [Auricularia subglabra TFB-10046 SS5]